MLSITAALKYSHLLTPVSESARLDVEVLLSAVLQKDRAYLYTWPEKALSTTEKSLFEHYIERRQQGEPVAYIVGEKEFWSLNLQVNSSTLIPRPETELLVETALEIFADDVPRTVIDLGTGTGAIALSLAIEKPRWSILAVDVMETACQLAEVNRQKYQLDNVKVLQSDWLSTVEKNTVDLIVSNPPYIEHNDPHLVQGDVRFEPHSALIAENGGLADIERIAQQSTQYLEDQGWLLIEHGYRQGAEVIGILQKQGFTHCFSKQDIAGHDRISQGQWQCA